MSHAPYCFQSSFQKVNACLFGNSLMWKLGTFSDFMRSMCSKCTFQKENWEKKLVLAIETDPEEEQYHMDPLLSGTR